MRNRRALSTIVGAVFFVIAAATSIAYITYSMDTVDNFAQTIATNEIEQTNRANEKFDLTQVRIDGGKFNFTIQNTGNVPVTIARLWVENTTDSSWVPQKFDINKSVSPGGKKSNIGQDIGLIALDTEAYDFKLITDRGNALPFSVSSTMTSKLYAKLHAEPKIIAPGFSTTLTLEIINNQTSDSILTEISPSIVCDPDITLESESGLTYPVPNTVETLERGDVATFRWVYVATGTGGDTAPCNAYINNNPIPANLLDSVTVKIENPSFASQSETALESEGLTCCKTTDDTLAFHGETTGVPAPSPGGNGTSFQTYSGLPELSGDTRTMPADSPLRYYSKNDGATQVDVPQGTWDLTLVMSSDLVPSSLSANLPDLVYFFDSADPLLDSRNNIDLTQAGTPGTGNGVGQNGTDTAIFDGDDYFVISYDDAFSDISATDDSTAGWFKTSTSSGKLTIYRVEQDVAGFEEFYDISINNGKVEFSFVADDDSAAPTTCTSPLSYADDKWHSFVAVRDTAHSCILYVDGSQVDTDFQTGNSGTGKDIIDITSADTNIGRDPSGTNYFTGELSQLMHWNNYGITSSQASDLHDANYGTAAHRISYEIYRADDSGNILDTIHTEIIDIPFQDTSNVPLGWNDFTHSNLLTNSTDSLGSFHFTSDSRLYVEIENISGNSFLDWTMNTDDNGYTDNIGSKLVLPTPNNPFPSYFQWDSKNPLVFTISNAGPNGMFMLFSGTRVIFEELDKSMSYAGLLEKFNSTTMNSNEDGNFMSVDDKGVLTFGYPNTEPGLSPNPSGDMPTNSNYRMYVSIVGYDSQGASVFRTFYVGVVDVCDPCT
ncbi:hypothetical protein NsoK4_04205 [Nitrosopumilus sp. K4]|uniref:LamG-like jellyroll fold domain-containing protein n=1 Tax=Nitrosopumilus sp. K4 TaxID=2795383 RepID=UPI001BAE2D70|nr:LamG-like jellyroll fold domain-containing protein [Nitrosopumilus sp. K4]QUC65454.1 hypothetical protein NsoK4_04205 [Nitrosopumilus sp. K4]